MNPNELRLIRSSFEAIARDPEGFASMFRERAVALDPSLGAMMPRPDRASSIGMVETVARMVDGLDVAGSAVAKTQVAALRHRWARIQPQQYGKVGQALLDTLSAHLGANFGDDARGAWADAFVMLAEDLMARSYNPLGLAA